MSFVSQPRYKTSGVLTKLGRLYLFAWLNCLVTATPPCCSLDANNAPFYRLRWGTRRHTSRSARKECVESPGKQSCDLPRRASIRQIFSAGNSRVGHQHVIKLFYRFCTGGNFRQGRREECAGREEEEGVDGMVEEQDKAKLRADKVVGESCAYCSNLSNVVPLYDGNIHVMH